MRILLVRVAEFFETAFGSRKTLNILAVVMLSLAIPLTIYVAGQQQDIRQRASHEEDVPTPTPRPTCSSSYPGAVRTACFDRCSGGTTYAGYYWYCSDLSTAAQGTCSAVCPTPHPGPCSSSYPGAVWSSCSASCISGIIDGGYWYCSDLSTAAQGTCSAVCPIRTEFKKECNDNNPATGQPACDTRGNNCVAYSRQGTSTWGAWVDVGNDYCPTCGYCGATPTITPFATATPVPPGAKACNTACTQHAQCATAWCEAFAPAGSAGLCRNRSNPSASDCAAASATTQCGVTCQVVSGHTNSNSCTGNQYLYVQTSGYPSGQCATSCPACPAGTQPNSNRCGCTTSPTVTATSVPGATNTPTATGAVASPTVTTGTASSPTATGAVASPTVTGAVGDPTSTGAPTATSVPGSTQLALTLNLSGIFASKTIRTPQRNILVEFYNASAVLVGSGITQPTALAYNSGNGKFTGTISLPNIPAGSYNVKVKTDRYLKKILPGIVTITSTTQLITIPEITLAVGDINGDNINDVRDYNLLVSCFATKATSAACGANRTNADLDDDGDINEVDYNILIRSFSNRSGD